MTMTPPPQNGAHLYGPGNGCYDPSKLKFSTPQVVAIFSPAFAILGFCAVMWYNIDVRLRELETGLGANNKRTIGTTGIGFHADNAEQFCKEQKIMWMEQSPAPIYVWPCPDPLTLSSSKFRRERLRFK